MKEWFKRSWKILTAIIGGISMLMVITGAVFLAEDRYTNQVHHEKDIKTVNETTDLKLEHIEYEIVMTLKQFREEQNAINEKQQKQMDYKYYMRVLDDLDIRISKIKGYLRTNPDNEEAKEELRYLQEKRDKVKKQLEELLTNG